MASEFPIHTPEVVDHERAYHTFNMVLRWSMLLLGTLILTLTLWFATPAGFWGAAIIGAVVFGLGYVFLVRHEARQPLDLWTEGR